MTAGSPAPFPGDDELSEFDGQSGGLAARRVGIRETRAALAHLVRRAATGERIIITVDGLPMAELGPIRLDRSGPTLEDLAATGLVRSPRHPDPPAVPSATDMAADIRIDRALDDLRG